jgi:hypothetical protein
MDFSLAQITRSGRIGSVPSKLQRSSTDAPGLVPKPIIIVNSEGTKDEGPKFSCSVDYDARRAVKTEVEPMVRPHDRE